MVPDLFFSQLVLIALVWLCLMLHWTWPSDPATCPTDTRAYTLTCQSAIVSANPLLASPKSLIATPVRMPATSVQRHPAAPPPAHRAHTGAPPPGGHLHAFLPQPRLCLSWLGGLGQSPRQRPSQWGLLAATAVRRLSPLFS